MATLVPSYAGAVADSEIATVASRPLANVPVQLSDESYADVRRFLNQNQLPPPDAVRIAELVNHFTYHDPAPTGDQAVAIHPEVWPCPWDLRHYLLRVGVQARPETGAATPPVAKGAAVQVEFNPRYVESYRLIGYEAGPRSRDSAVEPKGVDLATGQTFTALYELVPPGQGPKLKYQPEAKPSPFADNAEWLTVKLRYKDPATAADKVVEAPGGYSPEAAKSIMPSRDFQFAAAVAAFGMLLRDSAHKGDITFEQVRQMAESGSAHDPHGHKAEFLQLIRKAANLKKDNAVVKGE